MNKRFKSTDELFREKLEKEGRILKVPPEETFELITSFNRERAKTEAEIKQKEIAAEKELAGIDLVG